MTNQNICSNVICILNASGSSIRFGSNKLLSTLGSKPLINYVLDTVSSISFKDIILLTIHSQIKEIAKPYPVSVMLHSLSHKNESIALAMKHIKDTYDNKFDGIMFFQCDQALISEKTINKMLCEHKLYPHSIIRASYNGTGASPVIFPIEFLDELSNLPPGQGGLYVINNHTDCVRLVEVYSVYEVKDIDTLSDLEFLNDYLKSNS